MDKGKSLRNKDYLLGCFKIAPLSNFLTAQQISDGVLAADYEFDSIF